MIQQSDDDKTITIDSTTSDNINVDVVDSDMVDNIDIESELSDVIDKKTVKSIKDISDGAINQTDPGVLTEDEGKKFFSDAGRTVLIEDNRNKHFFLYKCSDGKDRHCSRLKAFRLLMRFNGDLDKVCEELGVVHKERFYAYYYNHMPVTTLQHLFKQRLINKSMSVLWEKVNDDKNENVAQFVIKTLGKGVVYSDTPLINIDQRNVKLSPKELRKEVNDVFGIYNKGLYYNEDGTRKDTSNRKKPPGRPKGSKNGTGRGTAKKRFYQECQEARDKRRIEKERTCADRLLVHIDAIEAEKPTDIDLALDRNTLNDVLS